MKNLILILSTIILLSSCSTITKIYSMSAGKIYIPQQKNYLVVYEASFGTRLTADISYTNADGKLIKLKSIVGDWKQTVTLKSGTQVEMRTLAKGGKTDATYKITVNGKAVSEQVLTGKRIRYDYSFDLP